MTDADILALAERAVHSPAFLDRLAHVYNAEVQLVGSVRKRDTEHSFVWNAKTKTLDEADNKFVFFDVQVRIAGRLCLETVGLYVPLEEGKPRR
ncbi:MAG TPA: hypothetical protein VFA10_17835 [Ktedonobacteraceae bacterium]|nr:hypothetical protein [Ktedonobacteraceae bacterium]